MLHDRHFSILIGILAQMVNLHLSFELLAMHPHFDILQSTSELSLNILTACYVSGIIIIELSLMPSVCRHRLPIDGKLSLPFSLLHYPSGSEQCTSCRPSTKTASLIQDLTQRR